MFTHPVRIIINWGSQLCCLMLHMVYHHCSVSAVHNIGMQSDVQSWNADCTFASRDAKPCTYSLMKSTCCSLFHPSSTQLAQLLSFLIQCNACICDVLSSQVAVFKAEQRSCPLWHIAEKAPSLFVEPSAVTVDIWNQRGCLIRQHLRVACTCLVLLGDVYRITSDVLANALSNSVPQKGSF